MSVSQPVGRIVVYETDETLAELKAEAFSPGGAPAPLALAYVYAHVDFTRVTAALSALAGQTKVVAVSTAGELSVTKAGQSPYCEAERGGHTVIVQVFPADLIAEPAICTVPLPDHDIRAGSPSLSHHERIAALLDSLNRLDLPFVVAARDTVALTFVEGLSACENYLMEAVYRSTRFPCLFIGGSAGGKLDFHNTYIFDGQIVRQDHAVIVFLKLMPGRGYGVLKSQNFTKTQHSFVVIEADADRRLVQSVIDPRDGGVQPFLGVLSRLLDVPPRQVMASLEQQSFGIEIQNELFVRSVAGTDLETGAVSFYCDVHPGDILHLLQATGFAEQTRRDVMTYLERNPPPLGAVLNDCILRRMHNSARLADLKSLWPCQAAGFSTFGELFGINVNETLSALIFFDTRTRAIADDYVNQFPVHYAQFCSYFAERDLNRAQVLSNIRQKIIDRLVTYIDASTNWAAKIEMVLSQTTKIQEEIRTVQNMLEHTTIETDAAIGSAAMSGEFADLSITMKALRGILEQIDSIASHTDMLSLNASIEAARAGSAGLGFAVVAQEVRSLSQRTRESLEGSNAVIQAIESAIGGLGVTVNATRKHLEQSQHAFQNIVRQVTTIVDSSEVIEQSLHSLGMIVEDQKKTLASVSGDMTLLQKLR